MVPTFTFTALTALAAALPAASTDTAIAPGTTPSPPNPGQPSAAAGEATPPTRLAIMALGAAGVPEAYAQGLTETIATSIQRTEVFDTISPKQIASVLAYEKRRDALGDCNQDTCYQQVARLLRADHLVAGSVAKVGEQLVLNLVLIDAREGSASRRLDRQTADASSLMDEARGAAIALLKPILGEKRGYLRVAANVPDAEVYVDDELRAEGVGQVIAVSAGPHFVRVKKDGFYSASSEVMVQPARVFAERFTLIPARETIDSYESKANLMRYGAYGAGALAVGAAVVSAVFYAKATDDKLEVDRFSSALQVEQAQPGFRDSAIAASDSFSTNQGLYLAGLGTAIAAGALSAYLFFAGDDPDRYEEFRSLGEAPSE